MLDETDVFIINSCISNASYEVIAHALDYTEQELRNRLNSLRLKGINAFPGMSGKKITNQDVRIYNLLKSGKAEWQIVEMLKLQGQYKVDKVVRKFEQLGKEVSEEEQDQSEKKSKSILSEEEQKLIIEMKEQGIPIIKIAEHFHTNFHTIEHRISATVKSGHAIPELVQMWIGKGTWHKGKIESITLDDTDKQILKLKKIQTLRETADELGIDIKDVKNRLHRMSRYPVREPNVGPINNPEGPDEEER